MKVMKFSFCLKTRDIKSSIKVKVGTDSRRIFISTKNTRAVMRSLNQNLSFDAVVIRFDAI
jgi:hypothetical protein